jgi:hypothetical protein
MNDSHEESNLERSPIARGESVEDSSSKNEAKMPLAQDKKLKEKTRLAKLVDLIN